MRIAGLQLDIAWEDPEENFRRAQELAHGAMDLAQAPRERVEGEGESSASEKEGPVSGLAERGGTSDGMGGGPELLVLPEMFATGFSMEARQVAEHAESIRDFLRGLARELGVHVLAGYAEPADGRPANACSLFDSLGEELLHFRKLHPFSLAREQEHYQAGDSLPTVRIAGVSVTALICYDLRFPEPFRTAARDTDLFCVLANWPARRSHAWATLLRARAMENQAFVLGVNRVGVGGGEPHTGDSALLDPLGMEVGSFRAYPTGQKHAEGQGIVHGAVDAGQVRAVRRKFGFLDDARPDLYRQLEESRPFIRRGS